MKRPQPLPEPMGSLPFTFQEALDAGVTHRRLRNRALSAPSRGIRVPAAQPEPGLQQLVRPFTAITEFSAAAHATAFLLWSMPGFLPGADDSRIHISRPDTMADMLDRHKGTPGIRKARIALELARVGSDSAPETRLRLALERAGLPEPELNLPARLLPGVVRVPDLAYDEHRVAVEYEGEGHSEAAQVVRDIEREEDFSNAGWTLVRISKRHMANEARSAVTKVRSALLTRGWSPK